MLAALALTTSACTAADPAGESSDLSTTTTDPSQSADTAADPAGTPEAEGVSQIDPSPIAVTASGLAILRGESVDGAPDPLVPLNEIRSGGPPPDGIPSIDDPTFLATADVDFLAANEPVLALEVDGEARAYPVQILMWHEIVNDTIAGIPVSVTYCPLCNSAVAYDRRLDDRVLEFGTSGSLWNSALVMYDRQTETLWSHFNGQAIVGELTGTELATFPVATVAWSVWRDTHPDGLVLSRDTGHNRDYGRNPYPGYDDITSTPFLFEGEVDGRYTAMTRIVGVELDGSALGVPLVALREQQVIATSVGATEVIVLWQPGTASALDASDVAGGDDVGATGVFIPVVDDQSLTFTADEDGFVDDQTGSRWNILGVATDGPLAGSQLTALTHVDTFWFAWASFQPDTAVVES